MRRAHRVDVNQAEIVRVLRRTGASVVDLSAVGNGCPDLLVGYHGASFLLEVKTKDGDLSQDQFVWHAMWTGVPVAVVRSKEDALKAIGIHDFRHHRNRTICPECGEAPRHCVCAEKRAVARELIPGGLDVARS